MEEEYDLLKQELIKTRAERDNLKEERKELLNEIENLKKQLLVESRNGEQQYGGEGKSEDLLRDADKFLLQIDELKKELQKLQDGDHHHHHHHHDFEREQQEQGEARKWTRETTRMMLAGIPKNEEILEEADIFEATIIKGLHSLSEGIDMVRRTKTVSLVAQRMLVAETEEELHEAVSRLIVALFGVHRCSFAVMVNPEQFMILSCNVTQSDFKMQYKSNTRIPIEGTSLQEIDKTQSLLNTPNLSKSRFKDHQMVSSMGLVSCMNAPILLNNKSQFFGTLNVAHQQEDYFTSFDELFFQDIARMFGENLYLKRLQAAERQSYQISQQLLYSVVPEPVIKKIQHHWELGRESTSPCSRTADGIMKSAAEEEKDDRSEADTTKLNEQQQNSTSNNSNQRRRRTNKRKSIITLVSDREGPYDALLEGSELDLSIPDGSSSSSSSQSQSQSQSQGSTSRALYAEDAYDVCIIFADIVKFSKISMKISTRDVMDMLQELFGKFDELCEKHKVLKLETVGDGFVAATGMLHEEEEGKDLLYQETAPNRALSFARDMILATKTVRLPIPRHELDDLSETVSLRVGVHCGDVTYGVLGQNLPKLTVFGRTINLAARMEQTCVADHVHVSEDFYEEVKVKDDEGGETTSCCWQGPRTVSVKNMGDVQSWLYNPL